MDIHEVLRRWLAGDGVRAIARATGLDRKTIRPFLLKAAMDLGLKPGSPWPNETTVSSLTEQAKRPRPPSSPGETERLLMARRDQIEHWLRQDRLLLTKIHELLEREGLLVPYSSLHRFARKWCDFGTNSLVTVRRLEGKPGEVAEVDFGRLGFLHELGNKKPRVVHAFIMTLGYSRLTCVIPTLRQDLNTVIHCFEEAYLFFRDVPGGS